MNFEKQLDKILGESKNLILPPKEEPVCTEQKSNKIMEQILSVIDNMHQSTRMNMKSISNSDRNQLIIDDDFLNSSLLSWSPMVSPVKVAQTKKLRKLSDSTSEVDKLRLDLSNEKSVSSELRNQLEKTLQRERQLRSQCEELLQTLDRFKASSRRKSKSLIQ